MNLQMGKVPQALAHLCPTKVEVPTSLWLAIDEAIERLTLATPSVVELQAATRNEADLRHSPAETTMPSTNVPAVGPMTPPWHHELQDKVIMSLQLAEFLDTKMAD